MYKIANKKPDEKEIVKVQVSIYSDEFETVKEELDIKEVTARNIRTALGLKETHSKTGVTTKLIAKIREMDKEEKEKMYEELKEE